MHITAVGVSQRSRLPPSGTPIRGRLTTGGGDENTVVTLGPTANMISFSLVYQRCMHNLPRSAPYARGGTVLLQPAVQLLMICLSVWMAPAPDPSLDSCATVIRPTGRIRIVRIMVSGHRDSTSVLTSNTIFCNSVGIG